MNEKLESKIMGGEENLYLKIGFAKEEEFVNRRICTKIL
jgi:hypothetical protein